jgi:hypothetical protein
VPIRDENGTIRIEAANAKVDLLERQGWVEIVIQPTERDFIYTIAVDEFSYGPHQARVRVKGFDQRGDDGAMLRNAITEIENVRFRLGKSGTTLDQAKEALGSLTTFLRGDKQA